MLCWICGNLANSGEHKTKGSDLRDVLRQPTQKAPLYFHSGAGTNQRVNTLRDPKLVSKARLCAHCNNTLTQPFDRAWECMSKALRERSPPIKAGGVVRGNGIFSNDTRRMMTNVQLYFVKLFGCHVREADVPIDVASFAQAITTRTPHPKVYLKLCCVDSLSPAAAMVGMSDMETATRTSDNVCAFATWIYHVGNLAVNVMFAEEGEDRAGLVGAWHPKSGTNRLLLGELGG